MSKGPDYPRARISDEPMTPEHWRKVKAVLGGALARDEADRASFLDARCSADPALRREVEALLAVEPDSESFLEAPIFDLHPVPDEAPLEGRTLGPYRLLHELGSGGMGRVHLAERADRVFDRRVAVKVLKRGLDTDDLVKRFQDERQILADLQHPGIAHLLDGGTTDEGLPYFVAEYVEGTPIDRYCDERDLPVEERLKLFGQVCEAVQFAHGKLVVHRDLKPANILITPEGAPKLLDFGIAKILGPEGGDSLLTRDGARFMTPEVASPEQVRGERIGTSSDVYSLGVLLYTLMTGTNPHAPEGASRREIERAVCEKTPERPSQVAVPARRARLVGDLDNITLTALRKEPERRYRTAQQLADDIRRHLAGLPVEASGDAWTYRFGKLVRRHKLPFTAVAAVLFLIVSFAASSMVLLDRTDRERQRAERVSGFLEELLTLPTPGRARGEDLTVREVLDSGRARIFEGLEEEPELRAELMNTMARVYLSLGRYPEAEALFEGALAIRRLLGDDDLEVAESLHGLAGVARARGDDEATEQLLREALAVQRAHHAEDDPEFVKGLNNLAIFLEDSGQLEEAEQLHRELLTTKKELLGPDHAEVAVTLHNLAGVLYDQAEYVEAERLFREALAIRERDPEGISPELARTLNSLASTVEALGQLEEAESFYRRSLEIRRRLYPGGHPELAVSLSNLALLLQDRGALDAAEPLYREALEIQGRFLPRDHPARAVVLRNLASLLSARGGASAAEAEGLARESLDILRRELEPGSWRIADVESVLGGCLAALGRYEAAEPLLLDSYPVLRDLKGAEASYTRQALDRIVGLYTALGQPELANRYRSHEER